MRRQAKRRRIIHAALMALAAGGLVAVDNPAPRVSHDVGVAMASAGHLAIHGAASLKDRLAG